MHHRYLSIPAVAIALGAFAAAPAFAHVTAQPSEQPAGGFTVVSFRVPNERPEPTNKVEVQFPDGISSARTKPVPGWTAEVSMEELDEPISDGHGGEITEQVDSITWSGGTIGESEFQEFPVSLRMLEEGELGDQVFFPAIQSYEGGEEVGWTEKPSSAGDDAELERPAPAVTLLAGDGGHGGAPAEEKSDEGDPGDSGSGDDEGDDDGEGHDDGDDEEATDSVALGIGIGGLVVALFALFRTFRNRD